MKLNVASHVLGKTSWISVHVSTVGVCVCEGLKIGGPLCLVRLDHSERSNLQGGHYLLLTVRDGGTREEWTP